MIFISDSNFYEILGVTEDASQDRIKQAFRRRAKQCHPDQAEGMSQKEAKRRFIRVRQAFDVLGNPESREAYDEGREHGGDNSQEKYEEEWGDFNANPEETIGTILSLVAQAGKEMAKEGISGFRYIFGHAFKYGPILTIPFALIIYVFASSSPQEPNGFVLFFSIIFGISFGFISGGFWGLLKFSYPE